jgi:uncharacterized protein YecT (DUF1311 family)
MRQRIGNWNIWLPIVAMSLAVSISQAASFDCAKAKTAVEKIICADTELSKLDEKMREVHSQANKFIADPVGFRLKQRQWLKNRDACNDTKCVAQAYRKRLGVLRSLLQAPKPCFRLLERKWPEVASGHYPVCVDLLKSMNSLCGDLPLCEWKVSKSVPSLSVPQWEELDSQKHLKLIQHMYQTQGFFKTPEEQWKPIPSDVLRNIQEGKARLWRTWIDVDRDGKKEYVIRFHVQSCEDKEYGTEFYRTGSVVYVTYTSMSQLDHQYSGLHGTDIIFHGNRPFVIVNDGGASYETSFSVGEPFSVRDGLSKGIRSVCVFNYLKE